MKPTSLLSAMSVSLASLLVLGGCSAAPQGEAEPGQGGDTLQVVTSFTILEDMTRSIGGDLVEVHNLVPTGTDPHEYEPLPDDTRAASSADLMIANGLNLEGGDTGWFHRLADAVNAPEDRVIEVAAEVSPLFLGEGSGDAEVNPHAFISPRVGVLMAEEIRDALMRVDAEHAAEYAARADAYIGDIAELQVEYERQLGAVPEEQRVLVTSERAFQYLAADYDLRELFIWEIDTEENGSSQQIISLVEALAAADVGALVMESNKDRRPMEMVSAQTGIPIYSKVIYSDEIGSADDPEANTYLKYLSYNLDVLVGALAG